MKRKSIAVAVVTVLMCVFFLGNSTCTTPVTEYVLTISSTEGGSVDLPGEGKYPLCEEQGESVNLVATPDVGYEFVNWTGDVGTIADVYAPTTTITVNGTCYIVAIFAAQIIDRVFAGEGYIVGLTQEKAQKGGYVFVAAKDKNAKVKGAHGWDDIKGIAAGNGYIVGVKKKAQTVEVVGDIPKTVSDDKKWEDFKKTKMKDVATGDGYIVGITTVNTVKVVGDAKLAKQVDEEWPEVHWIEAAGKNIVGRNNANEIFVAGELSGKLEEWKKDENHPENKDKKFKDIAASEGYVAGLTTDGEVVVLGDAVLSGKVKGKKFDKIATGDGYIVGLDADGKVEVVGDVPKTVSDDKKWDDFKKTKMKDIDIGDGYIVGVDGQGKVHVAGNLQLGKDLENWPGN